MPRYCGIPAGSYHSGEPHVLQNTRNPPPESNFVTPPSAGVMVSLSVGTRPHAAYAVPENFRQFVQWQYRAL